MADQNQQTAEALERLQRELKLFGEVTQQTADDLNDAKVGIKGFSAATRSMGGALGKLGDAAAASAGAMYEGKKGAAAFNGAVDSMAESAQMAGAALALLIPGGPVIKLLIGGITAAATAYAKYTKAANEMSDGLYSGYQRLSKAGAAASDGLSGVYKDLTKLGMGMQDLDSYVKIIGENSKDLAMFGGTVFQGRKQFVEMGEAMQENRKSLMALGMSQEDIAQGGMKYISLQTKIGQAQNKTTAELAEGAKKYLVEMDGLTKLTGQSRQEMEQQMEAARSEQRFRAKLDEMRASGDAKQIAAADELEKANLLISSRSKDAGQAFRDLSTGMVTTEAAQKGLIGTNGELMRQGQRIAAGQATAAEGAAKALDAQAKFAKDNRALALTGVYNDIALDYAQSSEAGNYAIKDFSKGLKEIKKEQEGQMAAAKGKGDPLLAAQVALRDEQINATKATQDFVFKGTVPATEKMIALAKATGAAAEGLDKLIHGGNKAVNATPTQNTQVSSVGANYKATSDEQKAMLEALKDPKTSERDKEWIRQQLKNVEARAKGGPVEKGSPYLVGEKGPELFVPTMAGEIVPMGGAQSITGASAEKADQIERAVRSIIDDTKKLEKITDTDTHRVEDFSALQKRYLDLKSDFYKTQITEMTIGQTPAGATAGGAADSTAGSTSTASSGTGVQPPSGGGTGLKIPSAPAPSSGAGGGMSQSDLAGLGLKIKAGDVQAEGAGISPKIISLAEQVQANMPGFAYFSGFNDKFHQEKSPSSFHTKGQAMDFALSRAPSPDEGQEIVNWLKKMGASTAIDEYNNPSSKATAGHIHAQIAGYADGGIANEPQIAMVAEKGPEAMVPLKNGAIPVEGFTEAVAALRGMQENMNALAANMADMLREQRNANDISTRYFKCLQINGK